MADANHAQRLYEMDILQASNQYHKAQDLINQYKSQKQAYEQQQEILITGSRVLSKTL